MINRAIYTLYLISRKRKLHTHFLMAGGSVYFILYLNLLTILNLLLILTGKDTVVAMINNEAIFLIATFIGLLVFILWAKKIIHQFYTGKRLLKRVNWVGILTYAMLSIFLFLFIVAVFIEN